jgi:hypothetical protein
VVEVVIAYLSDDIHVVIGLKDVVEVDYILMANFLHDFYLRVEVFQIEIASEYSLVYDFDCNWLARLDHFPPVD